MSDPATWGVGGWLAFAAVISAALIIACAVITVALAPTERVERALRSAEHYPIPERTDD